MKLSRIILSLLGKKNKKSDREQELESRVEQLEKELDDKQQQLVKTRIKVVQRNSRISYLEKKLKQHSVRYSSN